MERLDGEVAFKFLVHPHGQAHYLASRQAHELPNSIYYGTVRAESARNLTLRPQHRHPELDRWGIIVQLPSDSFGRNHGLTGGNRRFGVT
ncbi:hypothetical protein [Hymenobacter sp. BRD67]|uniref:hypothetical protein n=1 Tax=Hymenobacter sp. BRD67 TaxID=2675877 RepID=UPI00156445FB|nr:hypothetical protein [Hymenobacter sp. BRD67]QKG54878.1 hypothetical protein GKZ67_20845 [Hymenobacter sp. BRD67]